MQHLALEPTSDTSPVPRADWLHRGDLATPTLAVVPGSRHAAWETFTRRQRQAWEWRRLRRHIAARPGLVVDLGCGFGDWAARLTTIAARVVAVDVSPGFVAQTRQRLAATGHRDWHVEHADVRRFTDYHGADLVVLGGVLTYLDDDDALELLARVRDRLAPAGVVQQRDWCAVHLGRPSREVVDGQFRAHRRPSAYVDLARRAGLHVIEQRSAAGQHAEQLTYQTLGLRHDGLTAALAPLARAVAGAGSLWARRGSVAFFLRRA